MSFLAGRDRAAVEQAAEIWAEATSARDGKGEVAPVALALEVIDQALGDSPRSLLLLALDAGGRPVGFTATAPDDAQPETAKLRYLGVRPAAWGEGVARGLLAELAPRLTALGYRRAVLNVYPDNLRAVRLYERCGWTRAGALGRNQRSGKPEQPYELTLPGLSARR